MERNGQQSTTATAQTAPRFRRRIGNTTYNVSVHFSQTSRETMSDKIMRLIKNEAASGKAARL